MKKLLIILFKTFMFSTISAAALNSLYYALAGYHNYGQAVPQVIEGTLVLDVILTVLASPVLFLMNNIFWQILWLRLFLYFAGTLVFLIAIPFLEITTDSKLFYATGGVYLIVQIICYFRLTRQKA